METSTHERVCAFLWVKQDSGSEAAGLLRDDAEVPGGDWCRDVGVSDRMMRGGGGWGGGLRAVLERGEGRSHDVGSPSRLEGLPVDGTCSVFFIFTLRHPHLFKGVQRRQDGAADPCGVQPLLRSRDLDLHVFGCKLLDFS